VISLDVAAASVSAGLEPGGVGQVDIAGGTHGRWLVPAAGRFMRAVTWNVRRLGSWVNAWTRHVIPKTCLPARFRPLHQCNSDAVQVTRR
jgi:hypothetical protein